MRGKWRFEWLLLAGTLLASGATVSLSAQEVSSNVFAITGIALRPVWYNYCVPFNGVVIRAFNMRNGLTDECVTPKLTGRNGTFVLVQPDWSNGQAVRVGDVIRFSVTDPLNRLRRPLRCFPSEYTVEPWQVSQLNLRLNVLVY